MTVTDISKDPQTLTMRMTAELDAPPARAWELWADPRQLERWWGPPSCPATFVDHDLTPGGRVTYFMTLPDGGRAGGWWRVVTVEAPRLLEFVDGFADESGHEHADMPVTEGRVTLEPLGAARTRMVVESRFASLEDMERLIAMGMEEGMASALGQIDDILSGAVAT